MRFGRTWQVAAVATLSVAGFFWGTTERQATDATQRVIVQAASLEEATAAVEAVGGEVTHELGIINAVAATLDADQQDRVAANPDITRVHADLDTTVAGTPQPHTFYPSLVEADRLHDEGITGASVSVAVLDSGVWEGGWLARDTHSEWRIDGHYDAIAGVFDPYDSTDEFGHGTHVSSIIVSSGKTKGRNKKSNGLAPDARLIDVRAFDDNGVGSYADVIRGLQWVVNNRSTYNIRVLNLSFSTPPQSHYWDDPLNQAVMAAWQAGIVVVASAGNTGPDPMTIGVPGNVPYIITADYSPTNGSDDRLTSFSSAGPTNEAFVKPEVVAPGGHIRGLMKNNHRIVNEHSAHYLGNNSFEVSGTSQSAADVSGIVTLMIDQDPGLTLDEVKYRLMAAARSAVDDNGDLAYTIFQQGAGMVNA